MKNSKQRYADLEADGFEEVREKPRPAPKMVKSSPRERPSPYVVVDNKPELEVLARSNQLMQRALENLAKRLTEVGKRPKSLSMVFKRNSSGFMESVKVDMEY